MKTMPLQPEAQPTDRQTASLSKRMLAFALDYLVILAYIAALAAVTLGVNWVFGKLGYALTFPENPLLGELIAFITLILPVILYFSLQESAPGGATWGKRKIGIRVVNASGSSLTRKQALVRSLVKLLPWQTAHTCLFHVPGWPSALRYKAEVSLGRFKR